MVKKANWIYSILRLIYFDIAVRVLTTSGALLLNASKANQICFITKTNQIRFSISSSKLKPINLVFHDEN